MKRKNFMIAAILVVGLFTLAPGANSESLGIHCWKLQPWSDIVCFNVDDVGLAYSLHGTQHAQDIYRIPVNGAASLNEYDGMIYIQWDIYDTNSGFDAEFAGLISPDSLDGTWRDNFGDSGSLVYVGEGPQRSDRNGEAYAR